ncbi:MAG TPA: hypothetical protein VK795_07950 [Terriglobales bacterium]|jgi:hypothetical protein|nr:hypothetical protein [Terriglobales bacterium]
MDLDTNQPDRYRVEVSGWDAKDNFFVEETDLEWKAEDKKAVNLRCAVRAGGVVFVRLLQQLTAGTSFPVAYQVLTSAAKDSSGSTIVALERLRPKATYKESFATESLVV